MDAEISTPIYHYNQKPKKFAIARPADLIPFPIALPADLIPFHAAFATVFAAPATFFPAEYTASPNFEPPK